MRFRRLKLSGFKSFVEPAELRIEPGLTGIVGPNGCGKSNLLEAMRWVMGEGSPKSLRGGGMEDVIFAGTASRPARDFAEVSLLIEGDGAEAREREVTRRIERGAGSAYRLDGRDVRQKDVALLFADAATGAHSPALVSQGRIGAIIAAKPAERRQMLEEAAGIAGLHARRKDAEQKLRATEANLQRLDELLSDQEARVAALKRQARVAERYRQLTDRIRLAEGRLVYQRWAEADQAAKVAGEEARAAGADVATLQAKLTEAQEAQVAGAAEVARRRGEAADARERAQGLAHQLATARARLDTVRRRLAELERLGIQLGAEQAREQALREDAANAERSLGAEQDAIAARLANGEAEAVRVAAALTEAQAKARESEAALAGLLAREAAMKAERNVAEAALNAARSHAARIEAEAQRLSAQLSALGDGAAERRARDAAGAQRAAAAAAQRTAEQALADAEARRSEAADQRDEAEAAVASARAALAAAQAEQAALARALASGAGRGVLAQVRAAQGYERALAAALGDDLDAPVAQEGGRYWSGAQVVTSDPPLPKGAECLADHVEAPPALERRLRQIAVVDEDGGQLLAVGQRLVTRAGRLRRWDGFVATGNGAAAAERLVRQNRLAELAGQVGPLGEQLTSAETRRQALVTAIADARAGADRAREAIAAAERQAREASRAEDMAVAALERLAGQRALLEERIAETEPVREAAGAAVAQAETALAALPDASMLAGNIVGAREQASADGASVAERRAEQATLARAAAADRERQAAAAKEQRAWAERALAADGRIADAEDRARALEEERAALANQPELLEEQLGTLEQAGRDTEALVSATLAAEREADGAMAALGQAFAQANEAMAAARERRAGADARAEAQVARRIEYGRVCGEKFECPPPLLPGRLGFDPSHLTDAAEESATLERLTAERERLGPVNLVAEQELAELDAARLQGAAERDELREAINRLRGSIGSLNREGRVRLLDAYEQVDRHFRSLFTTLFDGGQAHLQLIDSDDPLEAGLEIMAQPPGKRLTALTLLSGGEQALTAAALIFALFLTNPAPICVLDEVDAPLDDANVERFCDLLVRMTQETDTRYLIVTHNAVTMSRMHRLYGVTMVEKGVSRLVSVDLGGAETLLAAE
ncbi:chromosome segregation protein SMC [Sphingomonas sp. BN140010]|uniref:Chromosome partition protein Smc n=1 Tax=Sphingomonas arvum TaxID=2992113 RepID=A0ABT3JBD3_9SPHN|nr:chromosome segregation protein SMC [Sphingomonas sp. BN140010]MCW3796373.1 chromosome segregation protein SMC [Sphingomonas sp. BN140010]